MPLGINLALLIGKTVPKPVPREVMEAFQRVEITHSDEDVSGFQLVFKVGRSGKKAVKDYPITQNPIFTVFNRVILVVTLGFSAKVLMDGVIVNQELSPSAEPGQSTFTITGLDVSAMMDLEERSVSHKAQDEATIARLIILDYAKYGLIPKVVAPPVQDRPTINERTPTQNKTDLEHLNEMAERFAYVFYVMPGPAIGSNTAYWGPPKRESRPQKALTMNMGSFTNISSVSFQHDAMAATTVDGDVQDRKTNQKRPVQEKQSDRPTLAKSSALKAQSHTRLKQFRETGRNLAQADAKAQAIADRSVDDVVTVNGELDTIRYGDILRARGLVGLRGVGYTYDGLYYVKKVTHTLTLGEYKQSFTLTRDGLGTTKRRVAV
jgi:hypothetical protein